MSLSKQKEVPFGRPYISDEERGAVMDVLNGHILTHGPRCKDFEQKFQDFVGGGYAVTTSSCMASLHLCSIYFELKPGDEVIVPAQTHVATAHAVELLGATPVFVDCELETGNMNLDLVEDKITSKTKAIYLVHFAGIPVEMDRVCQIASKYDLKIIEDCALAVGGTFKGKHVGLWGDAGCFSFYPVKHMTTAEGGMLISKNEQTVKDIGHLRAFSVDRTFSERKVAGVYDVTGVGLNYRMSEIQAAIGAVQVGKLPNILNSRKRNFEALKNRLLQIDGIRVLDSHNSDVKNSHYCLVAIFGDGLKTKRNDIISYLTENKIGCSIYYPQPVPRMTYYKNRYGYDENEYSNAGIISDNSIAFPVGPHLDLEDMELIGNHVQKVLAEGERKT